MLKTTRQGVSYAMTAQSIGGDAVEVVGGLIYREGRNTWRLVGVVVVVGGIGDILDRLFPRERGSGE